MVGLARNSLPCCHGQAGMAPGCQQWDDNLRRNPLLNSPYQELAGLPLPPNLPRWQSRLQPLGLRASYSILSDPTWVLLRSSDGRALHLSR